MGQQSFFLTGTDTDVGKTFVACALLHAWRAAGLRAVGYKPVAAGAEPVDGRLCNEDALRLQAASTPGFALERINPVCLPEAIAPHLAAAHLGVSIDVAQMRTHFESLRADADRVLVEGAGGFIVPLDDEQDMAQFARSLGLPVLLVVGLRLGCLNHALLTAEAIAARGLHFAGWIGNVVDADMPFLDENVATLRQRLKAPCLGVIPRLPSAQTASAYLTPPELKPR
ncbi:dethiobiotin synthase [Uliginosibacterium sp. H3]|uniref:ATP-dependent dethiobiotin synthetase BioD n=1 Tax=Uliginosibacterium silvisoli TaxID=3114758 RepID=A0ABU6K8I0_9RHOO|nr:dethiobiotin synthase [Uliginosibacterium sp. H3]